MSSISFIGLGSMASAIAARAIAADHAVELIGRDATKTQGLAAALGGGARVGRFGSVPTGDIVVLAVPYASAVEVVTEYGAALAGKVIVDITNTFNADLELVTPEGTFGAKEIAKASPDSAHVVKAFNTVFGHVLTQGRPLDVFVAGDDTQAKASVSSFITSLGLRPLDVGGLEMARYLEAVGPLTIGLAQNGVGFDHALSVSIFS
ncbi:NADPH-dependent F420 reductase [Agromyces subbeticus]|uniref:NADPH-dependent F420 reductase n=1 Tax=Agromyces subbeticus TaxID=293890 RepID=UPI0003B43AB1|nr:NAD(P)-binding domain-containing protein [Agromyces subbeticus]